MLGEPMEQKRPLVLDDGVEADDAMLICCLRIQNISLSTILKTQSRRGGSGASKLKETDIYRRNLTAGSGKTFTRAY